MKSKKNTKIPYTLIIYALIFILFASLSGWFLVQFQSMPFDLFISILIGVILALIAVYYIYSIFFYKNKKNKILAVVVIVIFSLLLSVANFYLGINNRVIGSLTGNDSYNHTLIVTLPTSNVTTMQELEGHAFGLLLSESSVSGYIHPKKMLEDEKITTTFIYYSTYLDMFAGLVNGEVSAISLPKNYSSLFDSAGVNSNGEEMDDEGLAELKLLKANLSKISILKEGEMIVEAAVTENLDLANKPFSVLLMGADAPVVINGKKITSGFNADAIVLLTINPKSFYVTVTSINRDALVYIPCIGRPEKINAATGNGGAECMMETVEKLLSVDIERYAIIDFEGFIELIDMIGGLYVDVESEMVVEDRRWGEYFTINKGYQLLDGRQLLGYSRNRKQGPGASATKRANHHAFLINEIVRQLLTPETFLTRMDAIGDIVSKNIATNFTEQEFKSLYKLAYNLISKGTVTFDQLQFESIGMEYWSERFHLMPTYKWTLWYDIPYQETVEKVKEVLHFNLGLASLPLPDKTWTFNTQVVKQPEKNHYKPVLPEGIIDARIMPNFVGKTLEECQKWANEYGVNLTIKTAFTKEFKKDIIMTQSLTAGVSMNHARSMIISVSGGADPNSEINLPVNEMKSWTIENVNAFIKKHQIEATATIKYVDADTMSPYPTRPNGELYQNGDLYKTSLGALNDTHPTSMKQTDPIVFQIIKTNTKVSKPTFSGVKDKTIEVGTAFDPKAGVSATDYSGKDITASVTVTENNVDTTKAGTYQLTYTVTDSKGLKATVTRTITVKSKATPPPPTTAPTTPPTTPPVVPTLPPSAAPAS